MALFTRPIKPAAASLLAAALCGCQSTGSWSALKLPSVQQTTASTATPGSAEFSSGKKLKNPESTHLAYARWQEHIQETTGARESYQQVLKRNPKSVDALLGMSRLEQLAGRTAEAEKYLERAAALHPNSPTVIAGYGLFFAEQKDWDRAIEKMEQACQAAPGERVYEYQLGVVLAQAGRTDRAYETFAKCVGPAEAHYNLGHVLHQHGRLAQAQEHFAKALELKPDLVQAQRMLDKVQLQASTSGSRGNITPARAQNGAPSSPAASDPVRRADFAQPGYAPRATPQ